MKAKELMKAYERCQKAAIELSMAQDELSRSATEFYGEELCADMCGVGEIEFRRYNANGFVDDFDTLRIEDLIKSHLSVSRLTRQGNPES